MISTENFSAFITNAVKPASLENVNIWFPVVISIAILLTLVFVGFMVFYFKRLSPSFRQQQSGKLQTNSNNIAVYELRVFSPQSSELTSNPNKIVDEGYQEINTCDRVMTSNVLYGSYNQQKEVVTNDLYNMTSNEKSEKQMNCNELYEVNFMGTDQHNPESLRSVKENNKAFHNEVYSLADPRHVI